jgi:hypothetical protein
VCVKTTSEATLYENLTTDFSMASNDSVSHINVQPNDVLCGRSSEVFSHCEFMAKALFVLFIVFAIDSSIKNLSHPCV